MASLLLGLNEARFLRALLRDAEGSDAENLRARLDQAISQEEAREREYRRTTVYRHKGPSPRARFPR